MFCLSCWFTCTILVLVAFVSCTPSFSLYFALLPSRCGFWWNPWACGSGWQKELCFFCNTTAMKGNSHWQHLSSDPKLSDARLLILDRIYDSHSREYLAILCPVSFEQCIPLVESNLEQLAFLWTFGIEKKCFSASTIAVKKNCSAEEPNEFLRIARCQIEVCDYAKTVLCLSTGQCPTKNSRAFGISAKILVLFD